MSLPKRTKSFKMVILCWLRDTAPQRYDVRKNMNYINFVYQNKYYIYSISYTRFSNEEMYRSVRMGLDCAETRSSAF